MGEKHTGLALRFISGKYQGNEFPLKANQEIIVGRGSEFDIVLVEDMVSRRHAKFVTGDDYVILQDLGSTNGSFVNGERIRKIRLREGDRILVGTSILKLIPHKGEDFLGEPTGGPLALPPGPSKETRQAPAFDASKALPPAGAPPMDGPPSLDFLPPPQGSGANFTAAAPSMDSSPGSGFGFGSASSASAPSASAPRPAHYDDELASQTPPPDFGQPSMSGDLSDTPILDLLEIFGAGRKNAVLTITSQAEGRVHFRNGRIIYATINNDPSMSPHKAAQRIFSWTYGSYGLYPPKDDAIHQEIDEDALGLYKQAQRLADEVRRHKSELPSHVSSFQVALPLRTPLRDLRPEYLDTFQLIYNYSTIDAVLNKSQYNDVDTYQHLAYLHKHNYITAQ
jgi:hypothetical protein